MFVATDIIAKKRDGLELSSEEIKFFVDGYTKDEIPDYQASAWCMAVLLQGMTPTEVTHLTLHMAHSGEILDLHSIAPFVVDKHSTGGVGDKTTLVVAPLVASQGFPVGKMSGRGLGFTGGTIDKLEAIKGFNPNLTRDEFMAMLAQHHLVVSAQTANLAPADGKFYALRDVTATVPSLELIAASIMSKKIASGTDAIVLDVKVGRGAFMKTLAEAESLAHLMVRIGQGVGRRVAAIIADMNQPLGCAVGNALEVKEAIDTLQGGGPADFREHCLMVASKMLQLADDVSSLETAKEKLAHALVNGTAWTKFVEWITAQGGDRAVLEDPDLLPQSPLMEGISAPREGYIAAINAAEIGQATVLLGGGRRKKGDAIDHSVGIILHAKVGDKMAKEEPLMTIHAQSEETLNLVRDRLLAALEWSDEPISPPNHIQKIIG